MGKIKYIKKVMKKLKHKNCIWTKNFILAKHFRINKKTKLNNLNHHITYINNLLRFWKQKIKETIFVDIKSENSLFLIDRKNDE